MQVFLVNSSLMSFATTFEAKLSFGNKTIWFPVFFGRLVQYMIEPTGHL